MLAYAVSRHQGGSWGQSRGLLWVEHRGSTVNVGVVHRPEEVLEVPRLRERTALLAPCIQTWYEGFTTPYVKEAPGPA